MEHTIQLTNNERLALEFFSSYNNTSPEDYIKECLHNHFRANLEGITMEFNSHWKNWLSGGLRADLKRESEVES